MKTITEQLADALRTIDEHCQTGLNSSVYSNWSAALEDVMRASREALAAYDAQQAQAQPVAASAWSANAGSVWDHTGKWIADCNREHAARIVQCVNAHDALVSALQNALPYVDKVRDLSGGDGDITAMNARAIIARVGGAK